jgi:hypothetical protein
VTGRNRTCDAPRFRRALHRTELRSHGWARLDSNQQLFVCKTNTLPLSYSPLFCTSAADAGFAGVGRNGSGSLPKLSEVVMAPRSEAGLRSAIPGQGVEPRSPRSERGVLPVRRSRNDVVSLSHSAEAERCFSSHSPTLRPWIADRRLRSAMAIDVLRGGALEPEPRMPTENSHAKAHARFPAHFCARSAEGLSLSGGASI